MTPAEVAAFLPDWPTATAAEHGARATRSARRSSTRGAFDAAASGEAGIAMFPVSGKRRLAAPTDKGIAIGPYLDGNAGAERRLRRRIFGAGTGALGAVGGVVFAFRPSGVEGQTGIDATAFSGAFAVELTKQPVDGDRASVLIGQPNGTRIEATRWSRASAARSPTPAPISIVAGGIDELQGGHRSERRRAARRDHPSADRDQRRRHRARLAPRPRHLFRERIEPRDRRFR